MGDKQHTGARLQTLLQHGLNRPHRLSIKARSRLIEQHDLRLLRQHARQRQALPFSGREAGNIPFHRRIRQIQSGEKAPAGSHIIKMCQNLFVPPARFSGKVGHPPMPFRRRHGVATLAAERNESVIRIQIGNRPQQDRFARPRRPKHRNRLARRQFEIERRKAGAGQAANCQQFVQKTCNVSPGVMSVERLTTLTS